MVFGLALLAIIYIIWQLLVRGLLWKLILFFAGWAGLHAMLHAMPWAQATVVVVGGIGFSWAAVIPTTICFLALLTTKDV
jgi:hypothetical protein